MSGKNSTQVLAWRKAMEHLRATRETYLDTIVDGFVSWAQQHLGVPVDSDLIRRTAELFFDLLVSQFQATVQSDLHVFRERSEDSEALEQRDSSFLEARDKVIRLRKKMEGIYGDDFAAQAGFSGETPREVTELSQRLASIQETLSKLPALPQPLDPDDPAYTKDGLINKVKAIHQSLDHVIKTVSNEKAETQQAQIQRRQDISTTSTLYQLVLNLYEGAARCAGLYEIAARLRPPTSSSSSSQTSPTEPQTATSPNEESGISPT